MPIMAGVAQRGRLVGARIGRLQSTRGRKHNMMNTSIGNSKERARTACSSTRHHINRGAHQQHPGIGNRRPAVRRQRRLRRRPVLTAMLARSQPRRTSTRRAGGYGAGQRLDVRPRQATSSASNPNASMRRGSPAVGQPDAHRSTASKQHGPDCLGAEDHHVSLHHAGFEDHVRLHGNAMNILRADWATAQRPAVAERTSRSRSTVRPSVREDLTSNPGNPVAVRRRRRCCCVVRRGDLNNSTAYIGNDFAIDNITLGAAGRL